MRLTHKMRSVCLHSLYLQENELEGPLPFEIGSMLALRNLVVYENQLDGEIPSSLGDCKHLKSIMAHFY